MSPNLLVNNLAIDWCLTIGLYKFIYERGAKLTI